MNALDGVTNAPVATVNLGTGTVDVTTQSRNTSGDNHFSLVFARALGVQTADIKASAQAKFGGFSASDTIPLTFSQCEADPGFLKALQFFPVHGTKLSDDPDYACTHRSSSGFELAGGFGWLKHPGTTCSIHIDEVDPWVESGEGNDFDSTCAATFARGSQAQSRQTSGDSDSHLRNVLCPVKKG